MTSLKNNFLYNVLYQILLIFIPLITAPYLSRILGAEGTGTYSYYSAIANYFVLFTNLGVSNYGNRSVARVRDDRKKTSEIFWSIYSLKLLIASIVLVIYMIYCLAFSDNKVIATIFSALIVAGLADISWLFFGLEQFKITVGRNTAIKIVTVLAIFIFVKSPDDLWKYTIIMAFGTLLSQIYLWFYIKKYVDFYVPSIKEWKEHFKSLIILFIPVIAYSIYKIMDKIMLGSITNDMFESGMYENAEKIVNIPLGVITAFGTVMLPRMSNMMAKGENEQSKLYIKYSFQFVTLMASAIIFGLLGVSSNLVPLYLGEEFRACVGVLNILSISVFFVSWANVIRTQYLIPSKQDNIYVISTIVGAVVNFGLNCILIAKLGAVGAAFATLVAEFSVMFVQMLLSRKEFPYGRYLLISLPYLVFGFIMFIVVYYIGEKGSYGFITLVLQVVAGVIVYTALCAVKIVIGKDDFSLLAKKMLFSMLKLKK